MDRGQDTFPQSGSSDWATGLWAEDLRVIELSAEVFDSRLGLSGKEAHFRHLQKEDSVCATSGKLLLAKREIRIASLHVSFYHFSALQVKRKKRGKR